MQHVGTTAVHHPIYGPDPYVIPLRAVERVRVRMRVRRARTDFVPLYVAAAVAGVACGFLLSVI